MADPNSRSRPDHEGYCTAFEAEIGRLLGALSGADLTTRVPTCPAWSLGDLLRHVGTVHRWADHIVRDKVMERVRSADLGIPTPGDRQVTAWLADGAETLLATLRAAGPDQPVWAWGADHYTRFWPRRMRFEALVHRADVELALGRRPEIEPATAADGVDEFLTILPHARWVTRNLENLYGQNGETLHLHATDVAGEWMIAIGPDGIAWEYGHGKGTVAVRAPAESLLLLLYGRIAPDDDSIALFGDRALLDRWLTHSAF